MGVKFVQYGKLNYRISRFKDGRSRLEIVQRGIRNITEVIGLNQLQDLDELDLSKNKISEITGLENLTNLKKLDLSRNQIKSIKGLENLTNLRVLNISYNEITDSLTIKKLKEDHLNLMDINLRGNPAYNPIMVVKAELLKPSPSKTQILTCFSDMVTKIGSQSPTISIFSESIGEIYKLAPEFFMQTLYNDIRRIVNNNYGNKGINLLEETIEFVSIPIVKEKILNLGTRFARLQIEEVLEICGIIDENLIIDILKEMITNNEIYAQYFSSTKAIVFDQQTNIAEIDKLMNTYKDWEEKEIGKK